LSFLCGLFALFLACKKCTFFLQKKWQAGRCWGDESSQPPFQGFYSIFMFFLCTHCQKKAAIMPNCPTKTSYSILVSLNTDTLFCSCLCTSCAHCPICERKFSKKCTPILVATLLSTHGVNCILWIVSVFQFGFLSTKWKKPWIFFPFSARAFLGAVEMQNCDFMCRKSVHII
jgi:hypothetical protein